MAVNVTIDREVITESLERHADARGTIAVVVPADAALGSDLLLRAMPSGERALWWQPELGLLVVAAGAAVSLEASASPGRPETERFASVPIDESLRDLVVVDPYGAGISPRLIGGFSFFADDTWEAFGPGDLVLPRVAYVREQSAAAWIVVLDADTETEVSELVDEIMARLEPRDEPGTSALDRVGLVEDWDRDRKLVAETIDEIRRNGLEKVVIARSALLPAEVDVPQLVGVLAGRYPECATFAFERGDEWFVGATPELLVSKQGSAVASAALAATAPRHDDPVLDRIELESLRTSKQLEEHRLVVEAVVAALEGLGIDVSVHDQRVMELRRVRHLATAIEGRAPDGLELLDLVGALHPTPAVGGVPGSGALDWIRDHEGFTRGWYAGPVGVMNIRGDGEFRVALRAARFADGHAHLYAGAGIVAGSDPDAEMAEIDLKLDVMAGAIEASQ